jgi:hypothetical protein
MVNSDTEQGKTSVQKRQVTQTVAAALSVATQSFVQETVAPQMNVNYGVDP